MIGRIRLRQWRSYESLDLTLGPGTTFVVAPNGVGKTSLMLGLAWGIFGDESDINTRSCIRAGSDSAEVHVELVLPDARDLTITRTVGRRGRPTVMAHIDGRLLDEPELTEELETAFEVELPVAARLSLMLGGGHVASEDAIDLKSHLYQAFGLEDLLAAAEFARVAAKEAERDRKSVRTSNQERLADRSAIEGQIDDLTRELERHREHAAILEERRRDADEMRRLAERAAMYEERLRHYQDAVRSVLDEARSLGVESVQLEELNRDVAMELVRMRLNEAKRSADDAQQSYASAYGVIAASEEVLGLLTGDSARCPTCLRGIEPQEIEHARAKHARRIQHAAEESERYAEEQRSLVSLVDNLKALLARLQSVEPPQPLDVNGAALEARDAESKYSSALEALSTHHQEIGGLEARLRQLRETLTTDDRVAESERELVRAYRREAVTSAAVDALEATATRATETLIEPIADEVRWRWKQLFSSDGLSLRPDGSIARMLEGEELGWETLSGGERIWARIVTHLLVLASSTKLSFAWFDEPLEHLDPGLRHAVAVTLATAARNTQLLVTTYEHSIADALCRDLPGTALINVRSSVVETGPSAPSERNDDEPDVDSKERKAS